MSEVARLLVDYLDVWTGAVERKNGAGRGNGGKLSLYGIEKLRALIRHLAVRGRLVPQHQTDEPASALLERINRARADFIGGRVGETLANDADSHQPLPPAWIRVRLDNLALPQAGFAFSSRYFNDRGAGLPLVRIRDVGQPFSGTFYSGDFRDEFVVERGDYLISMDGEFRVAPWQGERALLNQRVTRLQFYSHETVQSFVEIALQEALKRLQGTKAYTTVDHLSGKQIAASTIPFPPLAEQQRIMAKVDELMALCDALETGTLDAMVAHEKLVRELLATLVSSQDAKGLAANWSRVETHFDALFTTAESLDALKGAILDLAVSGSLLRSAPSDFSTDDLVQRLRRKNPRASRKLNVLDNQSNHPVTLPRIPDHWRWVLMNDVVLRSDAGWSPQCEAYPREGDSWGVLKVSAVSWGTFLPEENKQLPRSLEPRPEIEVQPGDVLLSRANTANLVARSVVVPTDAPARLMMSDKIVRVVVHPEINAEFVHLCNLASWSRNYYSRVAGGTSSSMKNVSRGQILALPIPLPSPSEQEEIVSAYRSAAQLVDALYDAVALAGQHSIRVADVLVSG
ncbi:restriction endonuclease subunit S [Terricaulis sp.]|uniref:restriction endonuclease subunit S n=1 Tax=Terricaulis sp. TaxID=2768686 RepID=UPI00378509AD